MTRETGNRWDLPGSPDQPFPYLYQSICVFSGCNLPIDTHRLIYLVCIVSHPAPRQIVSPVAVSLACLPDETNSPFPRP